MATRTLLVCDRTDCEHNRYNYRIRKTHGPIAFSCACAQVWLTLGPNAEALALTSSPAMVFCSSYSNRKQGPCRPAIRLRPSPRR